MKSNDQRFNLRYRILANCLLIASVFAGCSSGDARVNAVRALNESSIEKLTNCYSLFHTINQGVAPKSKAELIEFIASNASIEKNLHRMGIERDEFESFFTGRDGEPHKVLYGMPGETRPDKAYPIVFESVGIDGIRQVGFTDCSIKEISDDSEYETLKSQRPPQRN